MINLKTTLNLMKLKNIQFGWLKWKIQLKGAFHKSGLFFQSHSKLSSNESVKKRFHACSATNVAFINSLYVWLSLFLHL